MGQALLGGMIASGWADASDIRVVEVSEPQRLSLAQAFPDVEVAPTPVAGVDTLVAVKPHHVLSVCAELDAPRRVISVAAGITTEAIEGVLPPGTPVIRAMPNTPALVGAGASAVAPGSAAGADDLAWAQEVLAAVGIAVVVTEAQMDAVTGLSGSGPAYVFLFLEALTDAGVAAGLPVDVASALAAQTVAGAGQLAVQSSQTFAELRAGVTTPAGTTAAGLRTLERHGVRSAVIEAVLAAADRSKQLGS